MSEFLHPARHPDADQLSAFAEHVLPDHERVETLAHLAECGECRHVVFLAQRAQEAQAPLPRTLPGRTGWLRHWHTLWPVAAALTCGLLAVVSLQRRHHVDLPKKSDVASESSAPVLPSQAQPPQPIVAEVLPTPKSPIPPKAASSQHPAPVAPHTGGSGFSSVHGDLPMDHHLTNNLSAFSFNASAAGKRSADALSVGPYSIGGPVAQAPPLQEQKNSPLSDKREPTADLQSQNQSFSQPGTALRFSSEPNQNDMQHSASQTVEVTSAPSVLQTENAVVSASVFNPGGTAQARSARAPLPSKRFATSTTSNGLETLAIDSAGDLFLSKDAGIRWQRVARQWTGKAVKISLASPASVMRPAPSNAPSAGATASSSFEGVSLAAVATKVGFELTTDKGATWSSSDGLVWKRD